MKIGNMEINGPDSLFLIAGPCVIESEQCVLEIAHKVAAIQAALKIPTLFKASFDKANRSSIHSFRGPGLEKGLKILEKVKRETGLPVTSDIHETHQAPAAGEILDLIQIPAYLCRQTDLILSAAATGKPLNLKKGQFLAPWDMKNVVDKAREGGAADLFITERGSFFGYNKLVVDMQAIPLLQETGCPVIFDATHSVQQPGGKGTSSGGDRRMVPVLAKAAVAAGCNGLFFETHENPEAALSDGPNMLQVDDLKELLYRLIQLHAVRG